MEEKEKKERKAPDSRAKDQCECLENVSERKLFLKISILENPSADSYIFRYNYFQTVQETPADKKGI